MIILRFLSQVWTWFCMFISCFIILRLLREAFTYQFRLQIGMVGTFNLHWCFSSTMLGKGTPNCHKLMDYIYKWLCYVCFCWMKITWQHWLTCQAICSKHSLLTHEWVKKCFILHWCRLSTTNKQAEEKKEICTWKSHWQYAPLHITIR